MQVQAGVARTGKWWGHQHVSGEAVHPDILIFAKGIASGFPFAGTLLAFIVPDQPHSYCSRLPSYCGNFSKLISLNSSLHPSLLPCQCRLKSSQRQLEARRPSIVVSFALMGAFLGQGTS